MVIEAVVVISAAVIGVMALPLYAAAVVLVFGGQNGDKKPAARKKQSGKETTGKEGRL